MPRADTDVTGESASGYRRQAVFCLALAALVATVALVPAARAQTPAPPPGLQAQAVDLVQRLLASLPEDRRAATQAQLLAALASGTASDRSAALVALLDQVDVEAYAPELARLLVDGTGLVQSLERTAPRYAPLVRDGSVILLAGLGRERFRQKLVDQIELPADTPPARRLQVLLDRMPTLQKLGQIVARNPRLDPAFRSELVSLENGLTTESVDNLRCFLEERLGADLGRYQVELADRVLAEGTIAAVIRFRYVDPETGQSGEGVFKVVKPYVRPHLSEELTLFDAVAARFDADPERYGAGRFRFGDVVAELRRALAHETAIAEELQHLVEAGIFFADDSDVMVPVPLPLGDEDVLAMSFLKGTKITAGCDGDPVCRRRLAARLTRALLVRPVIVRRGEQATSIFHADPHAGNLLDVPDPRGDRRRDRVGLIDWGLMGRLDGRTRRELVQLMVGTHLRDHKRVDRALLRLGAVSPPGDPETEAAIRAAVDEVLASKAAGGDLERLDRVLEKALVAGLTLPADLLLFKKTLLTLDGVLHDLDPSFSRSAYLQAAARNAVLKELPLRLWRTVTIVGWNSHDYPTLLSNEDLKDVALQPVVHGVVTVLAAPFRALRKRPPRRSPDRPAPAPRSEYP